MAKQVRQAMRTLQTLRGNGKVYAGSEFLSDVRYTITVQQGIVQAGSQPSASVTDVLGTLVILEGERSWKRGTKLSLQMEAGRTADFVAASGSAADGLYGIRVTRMSARS